MSIFRRDTLTLSEGMMKSSASEDLQSSPMIWNVLCVLVR